jgi:hypothetical protein
MSKYNRTYHLPFSPGLINDDRVVESIDEVIGKEIVMTEKLDGENTGMKNQGVYARSHAAFTTSGWSREVRQIHNTKVKGYLQEDDFVFGENMEGIHSIEYTNLTSYFYMFGVRNNVKWLSWDEVEEYAYLLDLPTAPVLFRGIVNSYNELKDIVEKLATQPSSLGGIREGVVVRVAESFDDKDFGLKVMKWVRKGHVQTDEHWTKNWVKAKLN